MAQKKEETMTDNFVEGQIDTKAITQITKKDHRIRWVIENVSRLPLEAKIIGPDFYLTKTCLCNISFKQGKRYSYVYLENKSDTTIKIESSIVLFDCKGVVLHHQNNASLFTIEKGSFVDIIDVQCISQFGPLKDDILILYCYLKVEGCVTKGISFSTFPKESRQALVNDLKTMFNNPADSDFTLRIGNEIIYSHKSLLRARSGYFKRMFDTDMKESAENSVFITDVSHSTMQKLVEFLYTGDFPDSLEDDVQQISDLYVAADKYQVMDLKDMCAQTLLSSAKAGNICEILQLAHRHNDQNLKIQAMEFVCFKFDEIENTIAWKTFISSEPALASDVLSFCFKRLKFIS